MAGRNQRTSADYFSHDADASTDEKIIYLESKFGFQGYALYFKLLERMCRAEGFKLAWDDIKKAIYATWFGISVTELESFVTECCRKEINAFTIKNGYIFSQGLLNRMKPLIDKREYNRNKYHEQKQADKFLSQKKEIQQQKCDSKVKESKVKTYTAEFESFWSEYPNKKSGKLNAFKSWQKTSGLRPPIEQILSVISYHKKSTSWQKDNGQYIPMATTWLNQGRWDAVMDIDAPKANINRGFDPDTCEVFDFD